MNPVFVTAEAAADTDAIAAGFVASFTLGAGQFCTKPGLIFAPAGSGMFDAVAHLVADAEPAPLLTAEIAASFAVGVAELAASAESTAQSTIAAEDGYSVRPQVFRVALAELVPGSRFVEECFGPVALVCEYDDTATALAVLMSLPGSLAASVFTGGPTDPEAQPVVARLLSKVGRVALNAWPTGVVTTWSQQHGGPWPATSRPGTTSVGAGALDRFVRPVSLQNPTPGILPVFLSADNPWRIPRRIDGALSIPVSFPDSKEIS